MRTPRLVVLTVMTILLSATAFETAKAEVCRLLDGREFATNWMGDITYPTELVGFRLRERDDLRGFEIFRPFSDRYEVMLVEGCQPSFDHGGEGGGYDPIAVASQGRKGGNRGPRNEQDGGRDSGGHCDSQGNDDSPCAPQSR